MIDAVADEALAALLDGIAAGRARRRSGPADRGAPTGLDAAGPWDTAPPEAWREAIARTRAEADADAIAHREATDRVARELFGRTAGEILAGRRSGASARPVLRRTERTLEVPARAQIADIVPGLRGIASLGPGPRVEAAPGSTCAVRVTVTVAGDPATGAPSSRPGIVRLHGGGYWMGGGAAMDAVDRALVEHLAIATGAVVVDVDHRLAPEWPYPTGVVDALCVLDAMRAGGLADGAGRGIVVDPRRLALVGTSSGANIATVAALADGVRAAAPDGEGGRPGSGGPGGPGGRPRLAALALIVPSVLLADGPPQMRDDPAAWQSRRRQLSAYLGPRLSPTDPWVSPANRRVLPGMPPTFAALAAFDEVARGGEALCRAIDAGGAPAAARTYPMTHTVACPDVEAAFIGDVAEFLRGRLAPAG